MQDKTSKFLEKAKKVHGILYDYSKVEYTNHQNKVIIICHSHGEFKQSPKSHLSGQGCPKCGQERANKAKAGNLESFIIKANLIHQNKYDYSEVEYKLNHIKIKIFCKACDEYFYQTPNAHLDGKGCWKCGVKLRTKSQSLSVDSFIEKATIIHGNKYSYSKVDYVNAKTKVIIICIKHNQEFEQTPGHHLDGSGCPKCSYESSAKLNSKSLEDFIKEAKSMYGHDHNYDHVQYFNYKTKVKLFCNIHQIYFEKAPVDYFNGSSCPECMKESFHTKMSLTTEQFLDRAKSVHSDHYDYSKVNYVSSQTNITIFCKTHQLWFEQTPNNHLSGKGCIYCSWSVSRQERDWLNSLGKDLEKQKSIKVGKSIYRVDGYDPIENIAYEFMGDFWHGNPKVYSPNDINYISKISFGELYNKTLSKIAALKTVCKDVIVMWEQDWQSLSK